MSLLFQLYYSRPAFTGIFLLISLDTIFYVTILLQQMNTKHKSQQLTFCY